MDMRQSHRKCCLEIARRNEYVMLCFCSADLNSTILFTKNDDNGAWYITPYKHLHNII